MGVLIIPIIIWVPDKFVFYGKVNQQGIFRLFIDRSNSTFLGIIAIAVFFVWVFIFGNLIVEICISPPKSTTNFRVNIELNNCRL